MLFGAKTRPWFINNSELSISGLKTFQCICWSKLINTFLYCLQSKYLITCPTFFLQIFRINFCNHMHTLLYSAIRGVIMASQISGGCTVPWQWRLTLVLDQCARFTTLQKRVENILYKLQTCITYQSDSETAWEAYYGPGKCYQVQTALL